MSEMICAVTGCGQVAAVDYFVCSAHLAESKGGCEMNPRQCEFCDTELPPQAEYDACDDCIKRMSELINEPPVRTLQPNDTWGHCTRCGCATNDADVWREFCPRCQQLAALEAEIGRAVVRLHIIDNMRDHYDNEQWDATVYQSILRADALLHDQSDRAELLRLVAQWRKLHAKEGNEEAK